MNQAEQKIFLVIENERQTAFVRHPFKSVVIPFLLLLLCIGSLEQEAEMRAESIGRGKNDIFQRGD